MEQRIYTKATDRIRDLHRNYGGAKSGRSHVAKWFDNTDQNDDIGNFNAMPIATADISVYTEENYKQVSEQEFIDFMELEPKSLHTKEWTVTMSPSHYDNTNGSLYLIAKQRGWNAYQFDIIKRIDRALKKGQFKEDLEKTKFLIDLWLKEDNA